jgi:transposase
MLFEIGYRIRKAREKVKANHSFKIGPWHNVMFKREFL